MDREILNITQFKHQELQIIFNFLDLLDSINCCVVCKHFSVTNQIFGYVGVKTFNNFCDMTYYYYVHYNILNDKFLFKNIINVNIQLNTVTDVSLLFQIIQSNNNVLQNIVITNKFLTNLHCKLKFLSEIIIKKQFKFLTSLTCVRFKFDTLEFFTQLFSIFKQITLKKCDLSHHVCKTLNTITNKLELINIRNVYCKNINVEKLICCNHLYIQFDDLIVHGSENFISFLLQSNCKIITCDVYDCEKFLSVLPLSVNTKCIWQIKGFNQMYCFLRKYKQYYFNVMEITFPINSYIGNTHTSHIFSFAKILIECNNFRILRDVQCGFMSVDDCRLLIDKINYVIKQKQQNNLVLRQKLKCLYLHNYLYEKSEAKNLIKKWFSTYDFLSKLFQSIIVIE